MPTSRLERTGAPRTPGPLVVALLAAALLHGCKSPADAPLPPGPQTIVLFATPKFISDFAHPEADIARFLDHYSPLISHASETIVIFAVGNSDHILKYRGEAYWADSVEWARYTDDKPVSDRVLDYRQLAAIVSAFKSRAASAGINLKVFDQIEHGTEFARNDFKLVRHPECYSFDWGGYDIRGRLTRDDAVYASAPQGVAEGTSCGEFLVDQVVQYTFDLGFDGILYGNQLGTRGQWFPGYGPGYSLEEEAAIRAFLEYSRTALGDRGLMWFDSYNNVQVERDTWSFPSDGYRFFDYLIASGFCVMTFPERYLDNLQSKLRLRPRPRVLATLDYVDPWYSYNSMTVFPAESARLEEIAIEYRDRLDGIVFFANDEVGALVPRRLIESFAERFFGSGDS